MLRIGINLSIRVWQNPPGNLLPGPGWFCSGRLSSIGLVSLILTIPRVHFRSSTSSLWILANGIFKGISPFNIHICGYRVVHNIPLMSMGSAVVATLSCLILDFSLAILLTVIHCSYTEKLY